MSDEVKRRYRATVVENHPSDIRIGDKFSGKRYDYGNYRIIRLEDGSEELLTNGCINGTKADVGDEGWAEYRVGPSYGLWFFVPDKESS